jgi:hypothetical protein
VIRQVLLRVKPRSRDGRPTPVITYALDPELYDLLYVTRILDQLLEKRVPVFFLLETGDELELDPANYDALAATDTLPTL